MLPVSYARQHQLSHTSPLTLSTVSAVLGALLLTLSPKIHSVIFVAGFLDRFGFRLGFPFGFDMP